jgi:flagellar motor switch protein FliG
MATSEINPSKLTGPQKAAIFLLSMGEEFTTSLFKSLDEESIKTVGRYMSEISFIPTEALNAVMSEFLRTFQGNTNLNVSGREFLEGVVTRSLDEKTAREVFRAIGTHSGNAPFSGLSYLNLLPEEVKADIALRIVRITQVPDDLIRELDEAIRSDVSKVGVATRKFDGVDTLANILNEVDGKTEEYVLSHIENEDSDLADQIRQKMFVFEDLLQVDDRSFREILQNIDNQTLVKALKTASEDLKQKIFSNLSERASDMLREDMEVVGPVRLKEVEECQQGIIRAAKRLEADGKIVLGGKGEEIFVE